MHPETWAAILITPTMDYTDSIVIVGAERFANYKGIYLSTNPRYSAIL